MQQRTRTPLRKPLAACTHMLSEEPPLAASISPPASDLAETKKEQVRSVGGGGGGGGGDAAGLFPGGTGCSAGCSAGEESGGGEHKSRQAVGGKTSHSKISSMVGGKSAALAQGQTTSSEGGAEVSASWMRMKDSEKMLKDLSTCKSRRMLLHPLPVERRSLLRLCVERGTVGREVGNEGDETCDGMTAPRS